MQIMIGTWMIRGWLIVTLFPLAASAADQAGLDKALLDEARAGRAHEVASLLKQGASANAKGEFGSTPLMTAAQRGNLEVMQLLIDNGADVQAKAGDGRSVLTEAVGLRTADAIRLLLKAGAKPDAGALWQAGWLNKSEVLELLVAAGGKPDDGLHGASLGGHAKLVQWLFDHGANANARDERSRMTPLHAAAQQGGPETVALLLKHGAEVDAFDDEGQTPLNIAARTADSPAQVQSVKHLAEAGARLDLPNEYHLPPLRFAALHSRGEVKEIYTWLLEFAGGKEPLVAADPKSPFRGKSTKELMTVLAEKKPETYYAAARELASRGSVIMKDVLARVKEGQPLDDFKHLFVLLGPYAAEAIPLYIAQFKDRKQVRSALRTINAIQPGAFATLPESERLEAVESIYQTIVASAPESADDTGHDLVKLGPLAAPQLLKLLEHEDERFRLMAANDLCQANFADESLEAALSKLLKQAAEPRKRIKFARSMLNFERTKKEGQAALIALIASPAPGAPPQRGSVGEEAARALVRSGPAVIDELLPFLTPLDNPLRNNAMGTVFGLRASAIPRLIKLLEHEDDAIAISATVALDRIGRPAELALLETLLGKNDRASGYAARALRRGSFEIVFPRLVDVVVSEDRPDNVRVLAAASAIDLQAFTNRAYIADVKSEPRLLDALPVALRVLKKGELDDQSHAVDMLGRLGPAAREALPALRALQNDRPELSEACRRAIESIER